MNDRFRPHGPDTAGHEPASLHAAFLDEAAEHLAQMEQLLLRLDPDSGGEDTLHAIFRCVHSVKGGAAAFGLPAVTELAHRMETLLDRLRRGELPPTAARVDLLLRGGDALALLLAGCRDGSGESPDTAALQAALQAAAELDQRPAAPPLRVLELTVGPLQDRGALAGLVELFDEVAGLGRLEPLGEAADGQHRFKLHTGCSDGELIDLCGFHVDASLLRLTPFDAGHAGGDGLGGRAEADAPAEPAPAPAPAPAAIPTAPPTAPPAAGPDGGSLRVPVAKVDALVNLAGELLTAEAMLVQECSALEPAVQRRLAAALAELQRHARALHETAMSMRMIPVAAVFARFPRMLRELAAQLGKQLELQLQGEATELDKGMIEKIVDPLTHLLRNSCDHGIETPAERLACGKPEKGRIVLAASHQGGSIVIEVRDDGRGLSRERLLAKARERGLHAPDTFSDAEVWALIFAPGFSTATALSEVSGRGVGMDVVKRNIGSLGGSVDIDNAEGHGLSVRVRLPLTLAVLDGMTVRVADERYVLPLTAVVESFGCTPQQLKSVAGRAQLVRLRDEFLPVLPLRGVFGLPPATEPGVMVVVQAEGQRAALAVDELLGQQQVVVKNLETHVGTVPNIAGATLLGDGRVALILDVDALVCRTAPAAFQKTGAPADNRAAPPPPEPLP